MEGIKGHINYISSNTLELNSEKNLFELTIIDLSSKFNPISFFEEKEKLNDECKEYYKLLQSKGSFFSNVRIGLMHEDSDLLFSVGSDYRSYAYRAVDGVLLNGGEVGGNDGLREGDTIALCAVTRPQRPSFMVYDNLPLNEDKDTNINKDNFIKFYINGKEQEQNFSGLIQGKYYLVVTLYNKAVVSLNCNRNKLKYKYALV